MNQQYCQKLQQWYDTPLGRKLKKQIIAKVQSLTTSLPGTTHAQVSADTWQPLKKHAMCLCYEDLFGQGVNTDVLPNSIETLILIHTLDIDNNAQRVLHIADKLNAASGYLIIVGFNPISLFGILRLAFRWRKKAPWARGFKPASRVVDWLKVLNYQVEIHTGAMPIPSKNIADNSLPNKLFNWLIPKWSTVYILLAKQPLYPMTKAFANNKKTQKQMLPAVEANLNQSNKHD